MELNNLLEDLKYGDSQILQTLMRLGRKKTSLEDYLTHCAVTMGQELALDVVLIGKITPCGTKIDSLGLHSADNLLEHDFSYELKGTPCFDVINYKKVTCIFRENIIEQYMDDDYLKDMAAEAYVGTPLNDEKEEAIGICAFILRNKLSAKEALQLELAMTLFAQHIELAMGNGRSIL